MYGLVSGDGNTSWLEMLTDDKMIWLGIYLFVSQVNIFHKHCKLLFLCIRIDLINHHLKTIHQ